MTLKKPVVRAEVSANVSVEVSYISTRERTLLDRILRRNTGEPWVALTVEAIQPDGSLYQDTDFYGVGESFELRFNQVYDSSLEE